VQWQALLNAIIISSTASSRSKYLRLPRLVAVTEVPTKAAAPNEDLKMRMRFSLQWPSCDLHEVALACQRHMSKTGRDRNFAYGLITAGLTVHRWLATRFSFLYPERSFQHFPGSLSFSIMPPYRAHQFGDLGSAALVVAGSNTPGVQSCIVTLAGSSVALSLNLLGDGAEQLDAIRTRLEELSVAVRVLV
jgi:hypothetical protein